MVPLYQIFTVMANPVFHRFRHNAHAAGCLPGKTKALSFRPILQAFIQAGHHAAMNPACHEHPAAMRHLPCALSRQDCKIVCFAQSHPMYSGGFTILTEFLGVIVSPSISQPSFSHISPLIRSVRCHRKDTGCPAHKGAACLFPNADPVEGQLQSAFSRSRAVIFPERQKF